jgi:hypothetical protein
MRVFRIVALIALLTAPIYAYAQTPTLLQSFDNRTEQQKADDALREKSLRESQRKTPEVDTRTSTSVDAWGNVRSTDAAKSPASKNVAKKSKTAASAKPQTKTGTDAN